MRKAQPRKLEIWQSRIRAAESFPGGVEAYCRHVGIQSSSFYSWRRRLASPSSKSPSAFVPAAIKATRVESVEWQATSPMPDAKWVGEMLSTLLRGLA